MRYCTGKLKPTISLVIIDVARGELIAEGIGNQPHGGFRLTSFYHSDSEFMPDTWPIYQYKLCVGRKPGGTVYGAGLNELCEM